MLYFRLSLFFQTVSSSSVNVELLVAHDPVEEGVPEGLGERDPVRGVVHQHLEDEVEQLAVVVAVGHSVFLKRYRMRACTVGEIF